MMSEHPGGMIVTAHILVISHLSSDHLIATGNTDFSRDIKLEGGMQDLHVILAVLGNRKGDR